MSDAVPEIVTVAVFKVVPSVGEEIAKLCKPVSSVVEASAAIGADSTLPALSVAIV